MFGLNASKQNFIENYEAKSLKYGSKVYSIKLSVKNYVKVRETWIYLFCLPSGTTKDTAISH
jgi:hypothetical protein